MKLPAIKVITIIASLTVFCISLTRNAVTIDYLGIKTIPALEYFLMGSIAFIGGGALEQFIWLANPLSLVSIFLLLMNKRSALKWCFSSLIIAISFSSWNVVLGDEGGSSAKIISLELGYYLWVLSILISTIGTYGYFRVERRELDKENKRYNN